VRILTYLAWIRTTEQPEKTLYLVAAVTLVVLSWIVLSAFTLPSLRSGAGKAVDAYLAIANGRTQTGFFPVRYIPQIQQLPGVESVAWFTVVAFLCGDEANQPLGKHQPISINAYAGDVDAMFRSYGVNVNSTDMSMWSATENGILVGEKIANRCGFTAGITISPNNLFGGGEIPLTIIAVIPEDDDGFRYPYGHYDYINRFMPDTYRDQAIRALVYPSDPTQLDALALRIEREFRASDPPLEASVSSDTRAVLGRFGQAQALLWPVMGALAVGAVLVFLAITAHLVAQRRASMAVLQTLGFSARIQWLALVLELASIAVLGAALGIAAGWGVLKLLSPWVAQVLFTDVARPLDGALLLVAPAIVVLLALTLLWPAAQMARLKPIDSLRV